MVGVGLGQGPRAGATTKTRVPPPLRKPCVWNCDRHQVIVHKRAGWALTTPGAHPAGRRRPAGECGSQGPVASSKISLPQALASTLPHTCTLLAGCVVDVDAAHAWLSKAVRVLLGGLTSLSQLSVDLIDGTLTISAQATPVVAAAADRAASVRHMVGPATGYAAGCDSGDGSRGGSGEGPASSDGPPDGAAEGAPAAWAQEAWVPAGGAAPVLTQGGLIVPGQPYTGTLLQLLKVRGASCAQEGWLMRRWVAPGKEARLVTGLQPGSTAAAAPWHVARPVNPSCMLLSASAERVLMHVAAPAIHAPPACWPPLLSPIAGL